MPTATFGVSSITTIRLTKYASGEYAGITDSTNWFLRRVPALTASESFPSALGGVYLDIDGEGVINDSGVVQNIVVAASGIALYYIGKYAGSVRLATVVSKS